MLSPLTEIAAVWQNYVSQSQMVWYCGSCKNVRDLTTISFKSQHHEPSRQYRLKPVSRNFSILIGSNLLFMQIQPRVLISVTTPVPGLLIYT